jgi:hypothetical protein
MTNVIGFTGDQDHGDYVVIRSEPGYYAIDRYGRSDWDKGYDLKKLPVIAWLVEVDNWSKDHDAIVHVRPICAEELSSLHKGEIISPDGRVFIRGERYWENFEAFEAWDLAKGKNLQSAAFDRREELHAAKF